MTAPIPCVKASTAIRPRIKTVRYAVITAFPMPTTFREGTSASNEYAIFNNTVQASIDKARKRVGELAIELGEKLYPLMKHIYTWFLEQFHYGTLQGRCRHLHLLTVSVQSGGKSHNFRNWAVASATTPWLQLRSMSKPPLLSTWLSSISERAQRRPSPS